MGTQTLYIIGNGFDLHHEIGSSYPAFGKYVSQVDPGLHDTFENYFSFEGNWANLEETLARIDVDLIVDDASTYFVSYGAEDWSDEDHHGYQSEVDRIVKSLSEELKRRFTEWIIGLRIPEPSSCSVPLISLDRDASYLTFNYTKTLQKLYGVPPENVLHIHGQAISIGSELVLGHGVNPASIDSLNKGADLIAQDSRVTEANESIDQYFPITYKSTSEVISRNEPFLRSLAGVKKIYVIGHSLSGVDLPYFEQIVRNTSVSCPDWVVTYFCKSSIPGFKEALSGIGVSDSRVKYVRISEI